MAKKAVAPVEIDRKALRVAADFNPVQPGSDEHSRLLAIGYGMNEEQARKIVAEENPQVYPFVLRQKAEALLAALSATPTVVATRKMFRSTQRARA